MRSDVDRRRFVGAADDWRRKKGIVHDAAAAAGRDPETIVIATTNERPLPETDADSEAWIEVLSRQRHLGVSHFVLDFGNPKDTEPILRFAEQVIAPMRSGANSRMRLSSRERKIRVHPGSP